MDNIGMWFFFVSGVLAWMIFLVFIGFYAYGCCKSRIIKRHIGAMGSPSDFCAIEGGYHGRY
jgi:hypothetical protein